MNKKSGVLNILKRRMEVFVVIVMIMTMVLPYMGNVGSVLVPTGKVYADATTELQPETLPQEDATSMTTSYRWTDADRVDFHGKRAANSTYSSNYFTTRWSASGWYIDVKVKDTPFNVATDNGRDTGISFGTAETANGNVVLESNVEIKVTTKPSADKRFVLLDLYAFNKNAGTKYLGIRLNADTMIDSNDGARVYIKPSENIIHMANDNRYGTTDPKFTSFDIVNEDNSIKLNPFNVGWAGGYSSRMNAGKAWAYSEIRTTGVDSGANIGWKDIELHPFQKVHRRVAVQTRTTTFYVNANTGIDRWGSGYAVDGGCPGAYDNPFKTVKYAMKMAKYHGFNKYYIFLQTDCQLE